MIDSMDRAMADFEKNCAGNEAKDDLIKSLVSKCDHFENKSKALETTCQDLKAENAKLVCDVKRYRKAVKGVEALIAAFGSDESE